MESAHNYWSWFSMVFEKSNEMLMTRKTITFYVMGLDKNEFK